MKTKLILVAVAAVVLSACSSTAPVKKEEEKVAYPGPVLKLKNYEGPEAMDDNEVRQAQKQCILSKMTPNTHYLSVRTEYGKTSVPVRVICEPF